MANTFALILTIATLITGILWCINKFKVSAARKAQKQTEPLADGEQHQPGWVETGGSVFPVLFLVFLVRSFIYEPFQIPSGSMMPTLLIGDFILVEKFAYGIKDPITQTTLISTGHPKRGDIAVFKYPKDPSLDYIKRVVGLPGDTVTYDPVSKTVSVQQPCSAGSSCETVVSYGNIEPSGFIQTFSGYEGNDVGSGFYQVPQDETMKGGFRLATRQETLGGVTHNILLLMQAQGQESSYYQQPGQPQATWVVPEGMYFMMGDNRDNSSDSRYWGFVPERNLVGRATAIWMSFEKQEGKWPTGVRLSRIGLVH
ncbi:MAG: Signal peptidase I [Candidatus Erwinia impunctatus]|nr:Signal peptidase I [Culicoides impunctatus]